MSSKYFMLFIAAMLFSCYGVPYDFELDGGMVKKPNTQKGHIIFANCQTTADIHLLKDAAKNFEDELCIEINVENGAFQFPNPRLLAPATLFLIDDASLPTLLSAPEDGWAFVNVAKLGRNDDPFFESRVTKEISRGFAILCGAFMSQYANPLVSCITKPEQLDAIEKATLPFDSLIRIPTYLDGYGISPYEPYSYMDACQEGFAPAPTNEVQQAIWDKVHAIPSNPMKIEFDPKKGR